MKINEYEAARLRLAERIGEVIAGRVLRGAFFIALIVLMVWMLN